MGDSTNRHSEGFRIVQGLNVGADAGTQTIWHELGHIVLGAADEYPESRRPDGTPRPPSRVNTSDFSIMSFEANARRALLHARNFFHLGAWLRRAEIILGPRLNYLFGRSADEEIHALSLGLRAGVEGQFGSSGF